MYGLKSPRDRYLNDPQFKALVDLMSSYVSRYEFTPSELRLAAMIASISYEERRFRNGNVIFNIAAEKAFSELAKIETSEDF